MGPSSPLLRILVEAIKMQVLLLLKELYEAIDKEIPVFAALEQSNTACKSLVTFLTGKIVKQ